MRVYRTYIFYYCEISEEQCGENQPLTLRLEPNCKNCYIYTDWKNSGETIKEYTRPRCKLCNVLLTNNHGYDGCCNKCS